MERKLPKPNIIERWRLALVENVADRSDNLLLNWYQVLWQNGVPVKFLNRRGRVEIFSHPKLNRDIAGFTSNVTTFHPEYSVLSLASEGIGCDTIEKILQGNVREPQVWISVPLSFYDFTWQLDEVFLKRAYALAASRSTGKNASVYQEKAASLNVQPFNDGEITEILNGIYLKITKGFDSLPLFLRHRLAGNSLIQNSTS